MSQPLRRNADCGCSVESLSLRRRLAGLAQRLAKAVGEKQDADSYAIQVVEPNSGTVLYSHNAHKPFMPASNMKVVTTAAALKYLGAGFEYKTRVGLQNGALVVIGSGDPLLGDKSMDARYDRPAGWIFDKIVQALHEQGVAEVNDILIDTTVFDDERVHPSWPARDYNKWYACEICGVNFNDNCIEVTATNLGGSVAVGLEPKTSFVQIANEVEPVTGGDTAIGTNRTAQPNKIVALRQVPQSGRSVPRGHRAAGGLFWLCPGGEPGPGRHRSPGPARREGRQRGRRLQAARRVHHAAGRLPAPGQHRQSRPRRRSPAQDHRRPGQARPQERRLGRRPRADRQVPRTWASRRRSSSSTTAAA